MSEILQPCPFCGGTKICTEKGINLNYCDNCSAESNIEQWNNRPIEDGLRAEIARLQEKLHDEMSQLEIATDLGNKRWVALNDIYENGEKHNTNWCKRKAQEGLGIK